MKVILVSGKAGSGKDYAANILCSLLEKMGKSYLVIHFADYLKMMCYLYFGWDGKKDEPGRNLLQHIGNEVFRKFDQNFFADIVNKTISAISASLDYDYIIIPDLRYENELETIKNNFESYTIRVSRNKYTSNLTDKQKNDISEISLDNYDFDFIIENTTECSLKEKLLSVLEVID